MLGVGLQSVQNRIRSALEITKCDRVDYKVRQGLQIVAGLQSGLVQKPFIFEKFIEKTFRFIKHRNFLLQVRKESVAKN